MDEIQRKLALIDDTLAGRSLLSHMAGTAPLFYPAVGLMAGILLQDKVLDPLADPRPRVWLSVWLAALVIVSITTWFIHSRRGLRPETLAWAALFCFACLGAVRLLSFETARPSDIRHMVGRDRILATIRGRILTQPREAPQDWCFAQFAFTDPPTTFHLSVNEIKTPDGWRRVCGTIRMHVDEPTPHLKAGDEVQVYCWLHRFEEPGNPGQFNVAEYLRRRNIFVGASVPARDAIEVRNGSRRSLFARMQRRFAEAAARGLLDDASADTPGEAILEALLLGERRNIDRDTYEAFRRTGLLHLISLSGMHLGILVGIVWWLGKLAGFLKPGRAVVCMTATIVFLLVVPLRAPTLRAVVIVWAYCLSILLRRRANALNSLTLAAVVLLLLRPTQLFEAGWQLSFAAVAGILAFTGKTQALLHAATGSRLDSADRKAGTAIRLAKAVGYRAIQLLSAGMAAWLGSVGILLYHFFTISPLASLWTALTFLPVAAILTLGFLKILLSFLLPTLSALLGVTLSALTGLLIRIVETLAQIDFTYIRAGRLPLALILLYYALILFAAFARIRRPAVKRGLCGVLATVLLISLVAVKWQHTHRNHLSVTCLDVGHGQAILVQLPGTMNLLFDAGSLYGSDVGTRIVGPFLDYKGIGRLHAIVVSHHDIDHINGIPEIVDGRRVDRVYATDALLSEPPAAETAEVLVGHLEKRRVPIERIPTVIECGSARIRVLWPTEEWSNRPELGDNDRSLVCLIEYAGRKILLCSDIEKLAQQKVMDLYPTLKADVVVAPHHGSTATLDADFLEHLSPNVLICSCGRRDYEQGRTVRPAVPGTLLVTARDGSVHIQIDKAGTVETSAPGLR